MSRVGRDPWGVPCLWADDVDDLARLQGRVTALDRAWQIEVERWRSEGRLAAHIGPTELGWDRFARRARLDDTARRCFERLDPATRRWISAYSDGVNDGLAEGASAAPEFAALDCHPGHWQPWSPLGVFLVQHILFGTFPNKLWHAHVTRTLGPEAVGLFAVEGPVGSGSNAWAVPADPDTGRAPTLAGDPHRLLELPGVYQQIRLACPEFDVIGLAFPGVPGLPHFGHAGPVAWAVTNAMADYQDLYREQLRPDGDRLLVREPDGWTPATRHTEQIEVRGGSPVTVDIVETPRGPVIDHDRTTGEALSLRTPSRVESRLGFEALLPLLRARTTDDVADALCGSWVEPVNSVLTADSRGSVRQLVAGLVPVRDDRCRREPVPGWEPRHHWRGDYVPPVDRAAGGAVVCANDRRDDVAAFGVDFAPPHRARRIRALLAEGTEAAGVHTDTRLAVTALHHLLERLDPGRLPASAQALRERLLAWDREMRAASTDAGAFAAWRAALARRLYEHPAFAALREPTGYDDLFAPWTNPLGRIGLALDGVVSGLPGLLAEAAVADVPEGATTDAPVEVADIAAEALSEVAEAAAEALVEVATGPAPEPWGQRHLLHPIHLDVAPAVTAAVTAMRERVTLSGDNDCVLATSSVPGLSDACWRGPVARYVWDLTDRAASRWIVPFGASGRPGDPHFADQLPLWAAGTLIPVPSAPLPGRADPSGGQPFGEGTGQLSAS